MYSHDARERILDIITEFEATKIKDSRIFLAEESIKIMVWGADYERWEFEFQSALKCLQAYGFIKIEHKCGEPRWKLVKYDITN